MSKRPTRRSISVAGKTYARIHNHCLRTGISVSGLLERLIAAEMERVGEPAVTSVPPRQPKPETVDDAASGIFTF